MLRHFNQPGPAETMKELPAQGLTTQGVLMVKSMYLMAKLCRKAVL